MMSLMTIPITHFVAESIEISIQFAPASAEGAKRRQTRDRGNGLTQMRRGPNSRERIISNEVVKAPRLAAERSLK